MPRSTPDNRSRTEEIENADVRLGVPTEIVRVEIGV